MSIAHTSLTFVWTQVLWLWALAKAHPAVSVPVVGATLNWLFKPRTGEQYTKLASRNPTWLFTRLAAMLQLLAVIFPDSVKAPQIVMKIIFGEQSPNKIPHDPPLPSTLPIDAQRSHRPPPS